MIESFIEGRVRLRSPLLKNAELADIIRSGLLSSDAVTKAEVNPRTCGMLLEYDKSKLPMSLIVKAVPPFERINAVEKLPLGEQAGALRTLIEDILTVICREDA